MADAGKQPSSGSPTEIAEGLPPLASIRRESQGTEIQRKAPTAVQVFAAWEKLRILYNVVLALVVFCKIQTEFDWDAVGLIVAAVHANVGFCAGPVAEGYLCALGWPRWFGRLLVFGFGLLLAIALTVGARARDFPGNGDR